MPYVSALEVYSRQGAIQIHVYLYRLSYLLWWVVGESASESNAFSSDEPQQHATRQRRPVLPAKVCAFGCS